MASRCSSGKRGQAGRVTNTRQLAQAINANQVGNQRATGGSCALVALALRRPTRPLVRGSLSRSVVNRRLQRGSFIFGTYGTGHQRIPRSQL